jgi:hypothetical protein
MTYQRKQNKGIVQSKPIPDPDSGVQPKRYSDDRKTQPYAIDNIQRIPSCDRIHVIRRRPSSNDLGGDGPVHDEKKSTQKRLHEYEEIGVEEAKNTAEI